MLINLQRTKPQLELEIQSLQMIQYIYVQLNFT